ncbi:hypothetical protein [Amycolatopsis sp. NPDC051128]|uniref:hypothetical protein n=1 Tax=Amycolatopsis sp. NPDC051128 TaxID=3155412 RepID=UPI003420F162
MVDAVGEDEVFERFDLLVQCLDGVEVPVDEVVEQAVDVGRVVPVDGGEDAVGDEGVQLGGRQDAVGHADDVRGEERVQVVADELGALVVFVEHGGDGQRVEPELGGERREVLACP